MKTISSMHKLLERTTAGEQASVMEYFTYAPDFIIKSKRKRSRQAVDPCLGFYPLLASETGHPVLKSTNIDASSDKQSGCHFDTAPSLSLQQPCHSLPTSAVDSLTSVLQKQSVSEEGNSKAEAVITVEDFLRWSAQPVIKRYRRKKRKLVDLQGYPEDDRGGNDSEYRPSSPEATMPQRRVKRHCPLKRSGNMDAAPKAVRKRRQRRTLKAQPLADHLFTATVLSHLQPTLACADHTNDAHTCGRPPLNFICADRVPPPSTRTKAPRRNVVDPCKITPFHDAASSFAGANPPSLRPRTVRRPITAWQPVATTTTPNKSAMATRSGKRTTRDTPEYPELHDVKPLVFVPLQEHEALLDTTFSERSAHPDPANSRQRKGKLPWNVEYPPLPLVSSAIVAPKEQPQESREPEETAALPLQKQVAFSSSTVAVVSLPTRSPHLDDYEEIPSIIPHCCEATHPSSSDVAPLKQECIAVEGTPSRLAIPNPPPITNLVHADGDTIQLSPIVFAPASHSFEHFSPLYSPERSPSVAPSNAKGHAAEEGLLTSQTRTFATDNIILNANQGTTAARKNLKPLKPLYSFFDNFLETARSVAAAARSQRDNSSVTGANHASRIPACVSGRGQLASHLARNSTAQTRLKLDVATGEVQCKPRAGRGVRKRPSSVSGRRPMAHGSILPNLLSSNSVETSQGIQPFLLSRPSTSSALRCNSARLISTNNRPSSLGSAAATADTLVALHRRAAFTVLSPQPQSSVLPASTPYALAGVEELRWDDGPVGADRAVDFFGGLRGCHNFANP